MFLWYGKHTWRNFAMENFTTFFYFAVSNLHLMTWKILLYFFMEKFTIFSWQSLLSHTWKIYSFLMANVYSTLAMANLNFYAFLLSQFYFWHGKFYNNIFEINKFSKFYYVTHFRFFILIFTAFFHVLQFNKNLQL